MKLGHTTTVLPALKKSLLLDHESLLSYFGNMKNNEKRTSLNEVFVTDTHDFSRIRQVLDDAVKFSPASEEFGQTGEYTSPMRSARGDYPPQYEPTVVGGRGSQGISISEPNYF